MALTREAKESVVTELSELMTQTKITVVTRYTGTTVKEMQELRRQASESNTTLKIAKNRLVMQAMAKDAELKEADTSHLEGQLMYAFNPDDEVAPAQVLYDFAKEHPQLEFVGAYGEDGTWMDSEQVTALAQLPSKEQLQAQLVGTIAAPLSGFVRLLNGNIRGFVNVLNARAQEMEG